MNPIVEMQIKTMNDEGQAMSEPILKTPLSFERRLILDADGMLIAFTEDGDLRIAEQQAAAIVARCNAFDAMREELIESLGDTFYEIASKDADDWYCTNARSTAVSAGERLVELGHFEAHVKNKPTSRVKWFRPVVVTMVAAPAEGKGTK